MAKKDAYEERAEALLAPIAEANGCEIYDVEYVKEGSEWYLRAFIDKRDGVNINDCENVSRAFSEKLDEDVEVKTYKPIERQKEFVGILKAYDKDTVTIEVEENYGTKDMVFAKSDIAIIRLTLDF